VTIAERPRYSPAQSVQSRFRATTILAVSSRWLKKNRPLFATNADHRSPWTEKRLAAAQKFAEEVENFSPDDRQQLQQSLSDLVKQTPYTPIAVNRVKKLLAKGGEWVSDGLREILVDVLSEAIKKQIWG
jgi:hypothetical protein